MTRNELQKNGHIDYDKTDRAGEEPYCSKSPNGLRHNVFMRQFFRCLVRIIDHFDLTLLVVLPKQQELLVVPNDCDHPVAASDVPYQFRTARNSAFVALFVSFSVWR